MSEYTNIGHAIAVLRESAKQHRLAGDDGHARACDRAAELLNTSASIAALLVVDADDAADAADAEHDAEVERDLKRLGVDEPMSAEEFREYLNS